jgi:anti-sigma factor RsiW
MRDLLQPKKGMEMVVEFRERMGPSSLEHRDHLAPEDLEQYAMKIGPGERRASVEQHLALCQACRVALTEAEQWVDLMKKALAKPKPELVNSNGRLRPLDGD